MAKVSSKLAPLIAIIGCDGSGKSTVSEEILAWVQPAHPAETAHLGRQSGNLGRTLAGLPLVGGWFGRVISKKSAATRKERGKKTPGMLVATIIVLFSVRRVRRFRRMMSLRHRGRIIITDRYPQLEVPDAYDGPGLSVNAPGNPIVRWMARRERSVYRWMTSFPPDLVLRLNVDLDTAFARKPDHSRELLARKVEATPHLRFNGAPIVDIDATRPLPEVVASAKDAVRSALAGRGIELPR